MNENQGTETSKVERKVITTKEVAEMLANGLNRKQIGEHYGLNQKELKRLFNHPELKGKRRKISAAEDSFIVEGSGLPITEFKKRDTTNFKSNLPHLKNKEAAPETSNTEEADTESNSMM